MPLRATGQPTPPDAGRSLFLSASIPDPRRWDGGFDAFAITDAVVAVARTFLSAGWSLVTAAHPTVSPLLLYVAGELPLDGRRRIVTYQSALFDEILPEATRRFEEQGISSPRRTRAVEGDLPQPGAWDRSLLLMRREMFTETAPDAAVFVGGMDGITDEYVLFGELLPERPRYAIGGPGGAARQIALTGADWSDDLLADGRVYPTVARAILERLS
jgi:hypothetical protein